MTLETVIKSFPIPSECFSDASAGDCDNISLRFLEHTKTHGLEGILLAVDNPKKEPDIGWAHYGEDATVSHYIVYFPELETGVDWTARQFWSESPVPLIQTLPEIQKNWEEFPFQLENAEDHHSSHQR